MEPIDIFQQAVNQTGRIVAGVKPEQFTNATPCTDWDVRALLNHTIAAVQMFDGAARGEAFDGSIFAMDNVGDNPEAAYDARATGLRDALAKPGVLDAMWNMPFGTVPGQMAIGFATLELAQHGWDVARATGQQPDFDTDVTETALTTARMAGDQI
ncbi:MAG: TIGR03086 family protein, partial [Actinobacteria bacterium]